MKLITYDGVRLGATDGESVWDVSSLAPVSVDVWPPVASVSLLAAWESVRPQLEQAMAGPATTQLAAVHLGPPVAWPSKLIAYPANYASHNAEMNTGNRADVNGFFLKSPSSLVGADDAIILPALDGVQIHHECELAVVIGRGGRHIVERDALDHVAGYSCLVDVTTRGTQERVMRKSFDTFCPVGPWLVTADEIPDPDDLDLELSVNGEIRQSANTRDLIVGVREMISLASSVMTLNPGDVIATGTPGGVGPIVPGDTLTISIEHVGAMTLPVVAGSPIVNRAYARR